MGCRYIRKRSSRFNSDRTKLEVVTFEFVEIISLEPTLEFTVQIADEFQALFARLEDYTPQSVALWKFEGFTNHDIAEILESVSPNC